MNKKRLQQVVDAVRLAKPKQFNMSYWSRVRDGCGTVACAIGHFCLQHPRAELTLAEGAYRFPLYHDLQGHTAVAAYFDITEDEAEYLFSPEAYGSIGLVHVAITKRAVISRITKFIKTDGANFYDEAPATAAY